MNLKNTTFFFCVIFCLVQCLYAEAVASSESTTDDHSSPSANEPHGKAEGPEMSIDDMMKAIDNLTKNLSPENMAEFSKLLQTDGDDGNNDFNFEKLNKLLEKSLDPVQGQNAGEL